MRTQKRKTTASVSWGGQFQFAHVFQPKLAKLNLKHISAGWARRTSADFFAQAGLDANTACVVSVVDDENVKAICSFKPNELTAEKRATILNEVEGLLRAANESEEGFLGNVLAPKSVVKSALEALERSNQGNSRYGIHSIGSMSCGATSGHSRSRLEKNCVFEPGA